MIVHTIRPNKRLAILRISVKNFTGAANILKKVATTLGFYLKGVGRGTLIMPLKVQFWIA